jgi:hypothetical protein
MYLLFPREIIHTVSNKKRSIIYMTESSIVIICEDLFSSDKLCEDTTSHGRSTEGFTANDQWCRVQSLGYNAVQSVESQRLFRRNIFPSSQVPASCWFFAWFILRPGRQRHVSPKRRLTFNRLQGIISQKIGLFITTAVRTSHDQ